MNKEELKQYIDDNIYENQDGEITGEALNDVLKSIVDEGGSQVEANPTGEPTETLGKLKIGETIYTAPQGPQGEQGPANTLSIGTVTDGDQASASITGDAPNQQLNLVLPKGEQGDPGQNAVNPFKGWYTTDNIPTTGQEGDYCNVSDTSETPHTVTIYRWSTAQNAFVDTGEVPDTATGETFASSETLQQVAIDDSHLVNPMNMADSTKPVLAQADDVMQLKAKLEGVTAREVKAANYQIADGYIACRNYSTTRLAGHYYTGSTETRRTAFVPLGDSKSARFLGLKVRNTDYIVGYAYLNIDGSIGDFISSLSNDNDLSSYIIGGVKPFEVDSNLTSQNPTELDEITSVNPEGANYVALFFDSNTSSNYDVNSNNFYCYLKSGESVVDSLNHIDGEIDRIDKKFIKLDTDNPISPYESKDNVYLYNDRNGKIVTYSTSWKIIVYDLEDVDTDLYFDIVGSAYAREAAYVSELDYSNWPSTSGASATIINWVGYQKLEVGDKLEIPETAKYVLIEQYTGTTVRLLKLIDKFDDIYEDIDEINESLDEIEYKSKVYQPLKQYTQKRDYYIDSNYKAHRSTNYKLIVFDIQGKENLNFKTQRQSQITRYAVYVSEVDFSNIQKNSLYDINYKVGEQSYKDGDALSIPSGANYVILSYQYKNSSSQAGTNPVYVAEGVERYDDIESRIDALEENIKTNLPVYYKDFIESKVVEISDIFNSEIVEFVKNVTPSTGSYKDGFMFYSDPHYPENYMMTGKVMAEIIKNTPIKKLINGGDIVCSNAKEVIGYENDTAGAIRRTIDLLEKDISPVIETGAEYYLVRGNHDFSLKQKNNDDESNNETRFLLVKDVYSYIMSKNMRNPNVVIGNDTDDACCFYKDFAPSKLRYIFLDLEDANNMYSDANNTMRRGYTNKQHKWFCQTLLSTPSDYNIVVISHQPVLVGVYAIDSSYTYEHYNVYNKVMEAMLAVNNKESYVFDNTTYDFTDFAPKILIHQCGHTHSDRIAYNGVWENSIASAREGSHQGMEYFFNTSVDNSLVEGTANESLSDAIIIDNNLEGDINCVRLGPGCNRIIHQKEYQLEDTLDLSTYSQLTNLEEAGTIEWYCFDSDNNSYDASTTYSQPSVFRPWHIHATVDENGVVSVGTPTQEDLSKIPDNYVYISSSGSSYPIDYKPNKNISGYVTVIAYSADLRIMEFFGVKVIAEG